MRWPLTRMVHAPQAPWSQPFLVPVKSARSRARVSSLLRSATATRSHDAANGIASFAVEPGLPRGWPSCRRREADSRSNADGLEFAFNLAAWTAFGSAAAIRRLVVGRCRFMDFYRRAFSVLWVVDRSPAGAAGRVWRGRTTGAATSVAASLDRVRSQSARASAKGNAVSRNRTIATRTEFNIRRASGSDQTLRPTDYECLRDASVTRRNG